MRALLDINVLLALLDAGHWRHRQARAWLDGEIRHGWASCAITVNGFVWIRSQPGYPNPVSPGAAAQRLTEATATRRHEYWGCELSFLDASIFDHSRIHGPRQVTDAYLLGLAAHHGGRFVTFDRTVPSTAVRTAGPDHLVLL